MKSLKHLILEDSAYHSCIRKRRYNDYVLAEKARHKFSARYNKEFASYFCGLCGGFHLTSRK